MVSYGASNIGSLTLSSNGLLADEICMDGAGRIELSGQKVRVVQRTEVRMNVEAWKEEFYKLNEAAHETERASRWSSWGHYEGGGRKEPPSDADREGYAYDGDGDALMKDIRRLFD